VSGAPVTLEVVDEVARLKLARGDRNNAIDLDFARVLRDTVDELGTGRQFGAVVLYAEGDNFCVGGDLRSFAAAPAPSEFIAELAATMHEAVVGLRALETPVVTAVQGACAGAGIGLALAGDIVLAARDARFRVSYTAAGLSPDCGVSWALTRTLGPARAADLILTNRLIDADQAERCGLVSRLADDVVDESFTLAAALATGARAAQAHSVRLVRDAGTTALEQHLIAEAHGISSLAATPEGSEGISSFLEKRRPNFAAARRFSVNSQTTM
jgi:2-(1,2-epoxy-1,2-dihydrophenyl)acetyl-CoA isomerase